MEKQTELLLYAWGYWMRVSPAVNLGYPAQAVGADAIHTTEDKSTAAYKRRPYRKWKGRIEALKYMAPAPNPKQTRVTNPTISESWPDEIMAVDRIIASMPFTYRQCLLAHYWLELTRREAVSQLRVTDWYYRRQLDKAEERFEQVLQAHQKSGTI